MGAGKLGRGGLGLGGEGFSWGCRGMGACVGGLSHDERIATILT